MDKRIQVQASANRVFTKAEAISTALTSAASMIDEVLAKCDGEPDQAALVEHTCLDALERLSNNHRIKPYALADMRSDVIYVYKLLEELEEGETE